MSDEEIPPDDEVLSELVEELEELEQTTDSPEKRRVIRQSIRRVTAVNRHVFGVDDVSQQIVGGFILSAAFVVTEEVWALAAGMNWIQWGITVLMVLLIGHGALYRADRDRDDEAEESIAGLPLRFVSLILIAYLSVTILAFVLSAPTTFGATPATTVKAISIGAIFSVVGAATADSLL